MKGGYLPGALSYVPVPWLGCARVSREAVLITRGAKAGKYRVFIVYCYSVEFTLADIEKFEIELVKS